MNVKLELHRTKNCGVMEIDYLGQTRGPLDALTQVVDILKKLEGSIAHHRPVLITFTGITQRWSEGHDHGDARYHDYGQEFSDFLMVNGLGTVTASQEVINWTRNSIRLWCWAPNYKNITELLERENRG